MKNDVILLKGDLAFKMVFGRDDERCKYILKSLLQNVLDIQIDTIQYNNPINLTDAIDYRQTEFDISVTIEGSTNCDIEIQLRDHKAFNDRLVFYGATLLKGNLKEKESYMHMKKAIVICFADFIMFRDAAKYRSNFIMKERSDNYELSDIMEIVTLEMPKIDSEKPVEQMTDIEKWLTYLKYSGYEEYSKKINEIVKESEEIEMTERLFNEIKNDEQARSALLSRQRFQFDINAQLNDKYDEGVEEGKKEGKKEGRKEGRKEGLIEGEKKGKQEGQREIVLNMLRNGLSVKMIMDCTRIDEAEIEKIKKNFDL